MNTDKKRADSPRQRPENGISYSIAVIGSGMAGLAAAWRARCAGHNVTIFEASDSHGMGPIPLP